VPTRKSTNCWIENYTANSEKILLDLAANQLQLPFCVTVASIGSRGVVGQERLGTAFPHILYVLF